MHVLAKRSGADEGGSGGGVRRGSFPAGGGTDGGIGGAFAYLGDVRVVRYGGKRIEEVLGDDFADFLAALSERSRQVVGDFEVSRLALAPRQGVVGDLSEHGLHEAVLPPLG